MEQDGAPTELGSVSGELAGTSGGLEGASGEPGSPLISFKFGSPKSLAGCEEGLIFNIFGTLSKFGICIDGCGGSGVWVLTSEGFAAGIVPTHPSEYPRDDNLGRHEPGCSAIKKLSL